ncbi:MAG: hypothetical protein QOH38_16 [Thermoleophilaceae bacterium]|jgi:hypothetical protein|nr:hypothetical protein [Thermoleophilaceae bacterium]MEA2367298.1 hypothetical protein [Thermoleophilaceae bacterium]
MNARDFWRAAAVQLVVVAIPFAILGLALPHHFFKDYGFAVGPVLWVACSLVSGRLLGLPIQFTLFCAAAGGVVAVLVMLVIGHEVGIAAGIAVFAACASGYEPHAEEPQHDGGERLGAQSSRP